MRIVLATLIALALLPSAVAAAQAPVATTGDAGPVGTTTATVGGEVVPGGNPATWRFEYGTTTAYGLATGDEVLPAGNASVPVQAALAGLSPGTTYHYRLFVEGGTPGADRTFTTAPAPVVPAVPGIARLRALDKTPTAARLTALVDPNRAATTYRVEWGTSRTRLVNRTPDATLPAGDGRVAVSARLTGLSPHTRIFWRVVATNAAGRKRSGTAGFTTLRAPTGIALRLFPDRADWGGTVSVSGRVEGAGVNGLTVALEQSTFPYAAGFQLIGTARTTASGAFRFPARQVFAASRFRAVTRTSVSVTSAPVEALVRARVGIRRARRARRALHLTGRVQPVLPAGVATLQRRTRAGGWALVRRKALRPAEAGASRYAFRVRRLRRSAAYRVKVTPHDAGAHLGATSRALRVGKLRRR